MSKRVKFFVFCLLVLFLGFVDAQEPRFYISTEKIFTPGERASICIECRGLPHLDIRVYRIDDPKSFFISQADAHQPIEYNQYTGANALTILSSCFDKDKLQFRQFIRKFINSSLRSDIRGEYGSIDNVGIPSNKKMDHTLVKILKQYPLLRNFRYPFFMQVGKEWYYKNIPIYEEEPGVYLVEAVNGSDAGYTLALISRLALITKQSGDTFLCCAVDKITGQPVPGASITIIDNASSSKTTVTGNTDEKGIFVTPLKNVSQLTVIGKKDNQTAIIDPTFFPVSVDHRKVYIYTDRPVYRPSQEVFYKGIVRDFIDETYKTVLSKPVTVRVYDPRGNEITKKETTLNRLGTFNGSFVLGDKPPTGTYKLVAEIEGKSHLAEFKIKEYKKPKFKVDIKLEGAGLSGSKVNASVTGKYYFGPPVENASLKYYVYRTRFYIPWWVDEDYNWYYSEAEYRATRRELVAEGEGELDEKGEFSFSFETRKDDGDYTYQVEVPVKDKSNSIVVGQGAIKTSRGQFSIDIRSQRLVYTSGSTAVIFINTRDINNRPVSASFDFEAVNVGKKETVILSQPLKTDEKGVVAVSIRNIKETGHIRLDARGVDRFDNIIRSTASIWVAAKDEIVTYKGEGIEIIADNRTYRPGDKASFLVLSRTPDIPFLFTVEGGNLYHYNVHRFTGNACLIEIPLKSLYSPNIYVTASAVFQDHYYSRTKTVIIPPVEKLLDISMKTDKEFYKPGEEVTVDVRVRDYLKRPVQVELSLGVVDESIYAISPELAVVMQKFFYPRKRNNVRTNNSLTFNFYGYSRSVKAELASAEIRRESGLSSFKGSKAGPLREKFKDTCFWTPEVMTSLSGRGTITFRLPDNLTQWRLTARCVNYYTQLGSAVEKITSRRDLNILIDPPQTFTEGDRVVLPVNIKNMTPAEMEGNFGFQVQGGEVVSPFDKHFSLKGMGTHIIPVMLRVTGTEPVVLTAQVNAGTYSDGVRLTVPVTPFGVHKIQAFTNLMSPSENSKSLSFTLPGDAVRQFFNGKIYIHSGVYRAILTSLNYLAEYPYGCVEQTMSGFLPDVVLAGILEKQKVDNPSLKQKVDKMIGAGVGRLLSFQDESGHWGWWDQGQRDAYMTAYVMYGLTLARGLGYRIESAAFDKGLTALEELISEDIPPDVRVMCLYVLTLADRAPASIIMEMVNQRDSLSTYGLSLLTLAAAQAGKVTEADTTAALLLSRAVSDKDNQTVHWTGDVQYRLISHELPIETTAFALKALLMTRPQSSEIMGAVHWLMGQRQGDYWGSTRDTAAVVMALSHYIAGQGVKVKEKTRVRYRLNGGEWMMFPEEKLYSDRGESFLSLQRSDIKEGANVLELEKSGGAELFVSFYLSYYSREKDTQTRSGPLRIDRQYYRVSIDGNQRKAVSIPDDENIRFRPGEEFLVRLDVDAAELHEYMVLEDFIPAGFQVIEKSGGYEFTDPSITENLGHRFVTYKEVRDNRMVFFFEELKPGNKIVIYYLMRAALVGNYEVNPAVIRSMYFDDRRALSPRLSVSVENEK